ncbi:restriction endonuclease subunit S [Cereibacter sphaeroides]|uniref:restriction endonuclease subunit S n=1 Tax=Cereibacter sphaeroides TaxID=1063 RepID=UPI001F1F6C4E|nr:restriction endonuclease subunit S [Cereibacter sphaeroides]MCE6967517.1 restriction endonuclease subunit S [Cereibacter sphaeroides]
MNKRFPMMPVAATGEVQGGRQRSPHMIEGRVVPYLRVANVFDGYIDFNDINEMPFRQQEIETFRLRPGDILLNEGQSVELVGRCAMYADGPADCCFQNTLIRYRAGPQTDANFAIQLFRYCQAIGIFSRIAVKTNSIAHLGVSRFAELELPFPLLREQRKIAEILRTWDEAIEKLEALRAAKLRRHRALTHSLVFGTRQLDRFRTTDEVAAHRWFTLPATWGIKPIGKLAREISERNGDGEQHEVLSCSKYEGFVRSLEYFKKQVFSADLSGYKKIWRGDFGFPSNHVEEGSIGLQNLTDVGVVSPIYTVFRFAPEKVDADYAFAVLKTGLYRHIFEVSTSASVDRRGSLRWSEFSKLPFPLPSLEEQRAIAEVLRTAQTDLDALNTEIEALTRQKRGLMQKLLTGEWRVMVEAD